VRVGIDLGEVEELQAAADVEVVVADDALDG
jgi:hypothetical protein